MHKFRKSKALISDPDSIHSDYGEQEFASFYTHYGTVGFHPLVAFYGITRDFLKAILRPGNVYTKHYNEKFPETISFLRGDSGFSVPALYDLCEEKSGYYVIRLKSNAVLKRLAEELHPSTAPSNVTESEYYYEETEYQAKS